MCTNKNCAFYRNGECSATIRKNCVGCSFVKTYAELMSGREKASERISKLPQEVQNRISEKYSIYIK